MSVVRDERRKHATVVVAGLTLALATTAVARAQDTTARMTALAPSDATRTIHGQLQSILEPVEQISSGMRVRLTDVGIATRPYGTHFAGLCRQDTLILKYAPTDVAPAARDQPLAPYGVQAVASFHAVRLPAGEPRTAATGMDPWREECRLLDQKKDVFWFSAEDDGEAARGINLLKAATDAVKSGALKVTCDVSANSRRSCAQMLVEDGDIDRVLDLNACPSDPGSECFTVDLLGGTSVTIVGHVSPAALAPASVDSIKVQQYVIVT